MLCCAKLFQSCLSLCNPLDCSPPGSSVHGILQARILEWITMPSSRRSSKPRDQTRDSCSSCTAGRFFTAEPPGKPITWIYHSLFCIHQLMNVWVAPSLAIMHKCCYEHLCASFCMFLYVCITLRCKARSKIALSYGKFSKVLQHFTFPSAVYKGSNFSTSSPIINIFLFFLDCYYPNGYEVIFVVVLGLHFPYGRGC